MKLSAKERTGLRAMVELARRYGAGPTALSEIAETQGLPLPYLERVVAALRDAGLLHRLDFLQELLTLAKGVVQAEKQVDPVDEQAKAKAALTELFAEVKNGKTPVVIERIVNDIDEIVRLVRFPGWQNTKAGEREVQKALRKVIYVKYQVKDQDLFDKAFGYIRQYY